MSARALVAEGMCVTAQASRLADRPNGGDLWAHLLFIASPSTTLLRRRVFTFAPPGCCLLADGPDSVHLPHAAVHLFCSSPIAFLTEPQSMLLLPIIRALSYWCAYLLYSLRAATRSRLRKHLGHWGMVSLIAAWLDVRPVALTTHFWAD